MNYTLPWYINNILHFQGTRVNLLMPYGRWQNWTIINKAITMTAGSALISNILLMGGL